MSFPFYSRSSSKPSRSKDATAHENRHASSSFATAFNQGEPAQAASHARGSSKMRMIPFLGKRRKSMAALRSSGVSASDIALDADEGDHHKTVSQLANETAARMARSSLGAGSLSTGNLELPVLNVSPLKMGSAYSTPQKNHPPTARHTIFSSGSTRTSTPDRTSTQQNIRSSEKPKSSFLSRVTSRPSLSARYSSADLKSASKFRSTFKSSEIANSSPAVQRYEITHHVDEAKVPDLGDDKTFFTSPRVAPTPPNLCFASPDTSFSPGSPRGPSQSTTTLPSHKHSHFRSEAESTPSAIREVERGSNTPQATTKLINSPSLLASPTSLSLNMVYRSPRRKSKLNQDHVLSPEMAKQASIPTAHCSSPNLPPARPRPCHVRIGKQKVTLSVANVLETELGVEVGDSEEESIYDDSGEDHRRVLFQHFHQDQSARHVAANQQLDSSVLPPLSVPSDEHNCLTFKLPGSMGETKDCIAIESQSPLSALMTAPTVEKNRTSLKSGDDARQRYRFSNVEESSASLARVISHPTPSYDGPATNHTQTKSPSHAKSSYHPTSSTLGTHAHNIGRLDCISERSVPVNQEASRIDESEKKARCDDGSAPIIQQLQQSLDIQCARFDRLARHLLEIIQRHQNEKVQFESQISMLEKEARRREREIKGLRWLIERSKSRSSQEKGRSRRSVRVASMQSFLSTASSDDDELDLSIAMEMLSRASCDDSLSRDKDVRSSVDLSPGPTPCESKRKDLRRSKTMPDLHAATVGRMEGPERMPSSPLQTPSPDISGLGFRLDFPMPEPLTLPSIASTIMSSAAGSNASIPALTAAPTTASGLSIATKRSVDGVSAVPNPVPGSVVAPGAGGRRRAGVDARKKRMAGEWRPGPGVQSLYRPVEQASSQASGCESAAPPASITYANNLNKGLSASIDQVVEMGEKRQSLDMDAIFQKLVANSSGLLG